jgi:hypothetical protein
MVAKAALLKESLEKVKVADPLTEADLRLSEKGINNFALRCFNTLAYNREVCFRVFMTGYDMSLTVINYNG